MTTVRQRLVAYLLVALQFALLAALVFWHPPPQWTAPRWLEFIAAALGLAGAVWAVTALVNLGPARSAVPLPKVGASLRDGGLYRFSRHPIYTGLLAVAWSLALRRAAIGPLVLAGALNVVLALKARFEEAALHRAYPGYAAYAAHTPRFLPFGVLKR